MEIQFWAATDVGRVREHNEDNFLVDKRLRLFVVCDGMGGHAAGEVASALCVRTVRDIVSAQRDMIEYADKNPHDLAARQQLLAMLEAAVRDASSAVFRAAAEDESKRGMGTTCCLLMLVGHRGFIAHVGDSRIYLLRNGDIHQMTEDHSLYNEMVRLGKIKPGEQVNLPNKNAVTRAIGVREYVDVDVMEFDVLPHDRFLLCSDGLSGYFSSEPQIVELLSGEDVRRVTERNITFAVDSGGRDNVTAIIVHVEAEAARDQSSGQLELALEVIKGHRFFQYLNYKELVRLMSLTRQRELGADESLLEPGGKVANLFFVIQGSIDVEDPDGRLLEQLGMGQHFGELGFVDENPSEVRVIANEPTLLVELDRRQFMEMLRREPELAVKVMWNLLQHMSGRLRDISLLTRFGVALSEQSAPVIPVQPVPVSASPVAAAAPVAVAPVSVSAPAPISAPTQKTPTPAPALSHTDPPEEATPPSGKLVFTEDQVFAEEPDVPPPVWGNEETRRVMMPVDEADDEDLRATAEFRREEITKAMTPLTPRTAQVNASPSGARPAVKPSGASAAAPKPVKPKKTTPPLGKPISGGATVGASKVAGISGTSQTKPGVKPKPNTASKPGLSAAPRGGISGASSTASRPGAKPTVGRPPAASKPPGVGKPPVSNTRPMPGVPVGKKPGAGAAPSVGPRASKPPAKGKGSNPFESINSTTTAKPLNTKGSPQAAVFKKNSKKGPAGSTKDDA